MATMLRLTGMDQSLVPSALRMLGTDKLFLDGLVSVWQVGRQ
jgi:protease-4